MISRKESQTKYTCVCLLALGVGMLYADPAQAAGFVRFDTSSFLLGSDNQPTATTSLLLGPELASEGPWVSTQVDIKGVVFLNNLNSFTVEAANFYIATSRQWMPHHQITLGRRIVDWNEMEDQWNLGIWSARFMWNPIAPEKIGMTGGFYTYESAKWRVSVFGTPISPPERSFPIRDEGGRLAADSRDFSVPYERLQLMNQQIPIHYSIAYPNLSTLILRPGAAAQVRYGSSDGPWASFSYGVMPVHQVQMAVEATVNSTKGQVDAIIHPVTLFHHLTTAETGFRSKLWSVWASVSGESPIQPAIPSNWQLTPMGPALLASVGGEMKLEEYFSMSSSYLQVNEQPVTVGDASGVPLNLPTRFQYSRAFQMEGRWTGIPEVVAATHWTYDAGNQSHLLSVDLTYQPVPKKSGVLHAMFGGMGDWTFGVGGDLISSPAGTGYIGQFVGNDRVRGRISYAF